MNTKLLTGGLLVVAVIAVVGLFSGGSEITNVVKEQIIGATPGTDFQEYRSFGGVQYWDTQVGINNASSTVLCRVKPPFASSTLTHFSFNITDNDTGAAQYASLSTSSAANTNSTSSPMFGENISIPNDSGGGSARYAWSPFTGTTTQTVIGLKPIQITGGRVSLSGISDNIIRYGEYVSFHVATVTPGTLLERSDIDGTCSFSFREL